MSEPKLTPWFVNGEKPARKGVYERDAGWVGKYSFWNGRFWCVSGDDFSVANEDARRTKSINQNAPWRGLAHPPKAKP